MVKKSDYSKSRSRNAKRGWSEPSNDDLISIRVVKTDAGVQTDPFYCNILSVLGGLETNFTIESVQALLCIFTDSLNEYNSIHHRVLSTSIYLLLTLVGIPFNDCRDILRRLELLGIQRCHEWCETMIDEDDLTVILRDERGSYRQEKVFYVLSQSKSHILSYFSQF